MRAHGAWANSSVLDREDRTTEILDTLFGSRCTVGRLSDVEIAHLASVALSKTLYALGRTNPEIALISRAKEAQSALHEQFQSLPSVQRTDPTVLAEYRKAVVFQDLTRDIALKMVDVIRRYAALSEYERSGQIM